ncbi:MEDS domain-containing protein [Thermomonospora catenispora]|uniref:MEDS domain-containing protein n=1 Tax=Thermomonospora catenispora TaxID=2493090 RepID=UPI00111F9118|nr:MEDS domain-containing protein [Thermomonospora catenispora]TNY38349.1 STAS domain-containing protein [Thermomonospora catenispora]
MNRSATATGETYSGPVRDEGLLSFEGVFFTERPVGQMRPGDHAWLAFGGSEERERVVGAFVTAGLATEEKVVYVTDADPLNLPGVRWPGGADPHAYVRSGALRVLPRERTCLSGDRFDPRRLLDALGEEVSRAFGEGFRAVRITLDLTWATAHAPEEVAACEHGLAAAVSPSTMAMAICQVDRRAVAADRLAALRGAHEVLARPDPEFDDGVLRLVRTFDPPGLRLEGELDAARHTVFAERLARAAAGRRRVHLDCGRLRFMDPAALNVLVRQAMRLPRDGRLVLDRMPPHLARMIDAVGWARLPGLAPGRSGGR